MNIDIDAHTQAEQALQRGDYRSPALLKFVHSCPASTADMEDVDYLAHQRDACERRDVRTREALGLSAAIEMLVEIENPSSHSLREMHRPGNFCAALASRLDEFS